MNITEIIQIHQGVFSKIYCLPNGIKKTVAYYTPFQSVSIFDGDSAEVWQTIFEDKGSLDRAYNYILKNGVFEGKDKEQEARSILLGFIEQLKASFLVSWDGDRPPLVNKPTLNPLIAPEKDILAFMSEHHIFHNLCVELTYRCNERCLHCYCPSGEQNKEITVENFSKLIDEFEAMGGFNLSLTGGEILIREDIEDIFKVLIGKNIVVSIISNLTLLDDNKLDLISKIKPRSVGVSIYSAIPEIHDSVTGVKGAFNRSLDAIKKLRGKNIPVVIKTPLFNKTVDGYRGIKELATRLECEYQFDLNIIPKHDGSSDNTNLRIMNDKAILDIFNDSPTNVYFSDELMTKGTKKELCQTICGAGQTGLTISPYGNVRPCISLAKSIGRYPEHSLAELWESTKLKEAVSGLKIEKFNQCSKCPDLDICTPCVGTWKGKDIPDSYTCFLSELKRRNQTKGGLV